MACIVPRRIINRKYVKYVKEFETRVRSPGSSYAMKKLLVLLRKKQDWTNTRYACYAPLLLGCSISDYEGRNDFYVDVPCGRCINCLKSYMTKWRTRLMYEYEYMSSLQRDNTWWFTLTFSDTYYRRDDFDVYTLKKRFIDRIRKDIGTTPRYWMITEFGEQYGRLHLHGIFFDCPFDIADLERYWLYGIVDYQLCNEDSIKYVTSYITKYADDIIVAPQDVQRVFCSPGIGRAYADDPINVRWHHPKPQELIPIMYTPSGFPVGMPKYFRDKIFTADELEDVVEQYFNEMSDDVIPEPPYFIGKRQYTDYTLFLKDCIPYIKKYRTLYSKHSQSKITKQITDLYG